MAPSSYFGRDVKLLVSAAFAVVSTQSALSQRGGLWTVILMYNS
jgi:hypothetical protein